MPPSRPALDLLCLGEMGIGNTTAAAALAAALFGGTGADWAGRGTGVDDAGLARKIAAIDAALSRNALSRTAGEGGVRARPTRWPPPPASAAANSRPSSAPSSPRAITACRCCSTASSAPPPPPRWPC